MDGRLFSDSENLSNTEQTEVENLKEKLKDYEEELKNLRASASELKALIDAISDVVIILDDEGRYLKFSENTPDTLLYAHHDKLIGNKITNIFPGERGKIFMQKINQAITLNKTVHIEYNLNIDKKEKWFTASISPIDSSRVLWFARDVSDLHNSQFRMIENESKYKTLFETANDAILLIKDNKFVECNSKALKIFGCSREEIINSTPYRFSPAIQKDGKDSKEKALLKMEEAFKNKPQFFEWKHCKLNGKEFDTEVSLNRVKIGNEYFLQTIIRDISERKNTLELIKSSEIKFRLIWENSHDGMRLADENGIVLMVNEAYCKMIGKSKHELENRLISEAYMKKNKTHIIHQHKARINEDKVKPLVENEFTLWNNKKVWYSVSNSVFSVDSKHKYVLATFRDISEKKLAESKIQRLAHALKSINECVSITDMNENLIYVNPAFLETYGYKENELIGKNINMLRASVNKKNSLAEIHENSLHGGWHGELINKKKDGTEFPISLTTSIVKNENGKPIALIGVASDITERKKAEQKDALTLSLLHATLESTNDGILVVNTDAEMTGYNQKFAKMWDMPEDLLAQEKREKLVEYVIPQLKNAGTFLNNLKEIYTQPNEESFDVLELKDGRIFERYSKPQKVGEAVVGRVWSFRDVTERVQDEKIKNTLYKISQATNASDNINNLYKYIHDVIKELMPADNFYIALYDKQKDLITFPYFVDQFDSPPPPQKVGRGLTGYVLRTGKNMLVTKQHDRELQNKNEVELVGKASAVWLGIRLKHEDKTIGLMVVQDYENEDAYGESEKQVLTFVSEQIAQAIDKKRTADELLKYTEELKRSKSLLEERAAELARVNINLERSEKKLIEINSSKDKLFSIIAHDLRSPFHPLLGLSEILANERDSLTPKEIDNFTKEIYQAIKNQYSLLENLLEWARIQTGKIEFVPQEITLKSLVQEAMNILNVNSLKKNISLENVVELNHRVEADLNSLRSVLQNLISNSIKFTRNNGKVTVTSEKKDGFIEVSVIDNGVGIAEKDQEKIFKADSHISTLGTAHEKGSGLGLVLCKELIEKNNGTIKLKSQPGKGTKITFTLPVISNN